MKYHKRFKRIKPFVVRRTKFMLKGWSYKTENKRWGSLEAWSIMVTLDRRGYHGMARPMLYKDPSAGSGYYVPATNTIHMAHPSVITYLHEFRHAMQAQGFAGEFRDAEDDARAWSLSLYYSVAPRSLRRLVEAGQVYHLTAEDLAS